MCFRFLRVSQGTNEMNLPLSLLISRRSSPDISRSGRASNPKENGVFVSLFLCVSHTHIYICMYIYTHTVFLLFFSLYHDFPVCISPVPSLWGSQGLSLPLSFSVTVPLCVLVAWSPWALLSVHTRVCVCPDIRGWMDGWNETCIPAWQFSQNCFVAMS